MLHTRTGANVFDNLWNKAILAEERREEQSETKILTNKEEIVNKIKNFLANYRHVQDLAHTTVHNWLI